MKKIMNNFNKIFLIFLYLQPFLDVTTGILLHFGYSVTISSIIRLLFMFICIIYLIFYIKNKKINIYLSIVGLYFILFTLLISITKGTPALTYELKNLLTTYYFVFLLLTLIITYKKEKFNIKNILILYVIYLLLVFIPNILGIGFDSYWHSKEGSVGWFVSANVVGSILSILLPLLLTNIKKINIKLIILTLINLYVIFGIGTKVPVLSFILIITINILYYVITLIKKRNYKQLIFIILPIIIVTILGTLLFPKTSFCKNIVIHINYLQEKDNNNISAKNIINHLIFSERITFEEKTRKVYNESNILEKLFGIGYIENYATDKVSLKTVEIDYFDVFYRHGIIGFIIFFSPVVYVIKKILTDIKKINYKTLNFIVSISLCIILALFQGHIFVTPANSIYVALILSLIYNKSFKYENKPKK